MKKINLLLFLICSIVAVLVPEMVSCERNRVIVGVLAQEWNENGTEYYIAASYIKYLESAGARVAPIFINKTDDYYDKLMDQINGLLLPGEGNNSSRVGYNKTINHLLKKAVDLNQKGVYFPVWATCISFERLIEYFANSTDLFTDCNAENLALPTEFEVDITSNSKMFVNATHIIEIMARDNVTAHYHRKCLNIDDFNRYKLDAHFTVLGHSRIQDSSSVSIIESKIFPFYGTSFNPEKNQFEFVVGEHVGNIDHGPNAILVGQFFANFFVNEARKNDQHFPDKLQEMNVLIYNFNHNRIYTGNGPNSYYEEIYLFTKDSANIFGGTLWSTVVMTVVALMVNDLLVGK